MRVFRGLPNPDSRTPCVLTIGNFDGVHRGHQALLSRLRAEADKRSLPTCVMTFEPHPREFFAPQQAPARIANLRDKLAALAEYGVERVIVEHFNSAFAQQTPSAFLEHTIAHGCHARWITVGEDFRFGAKRAGDITLMTKEGDRLGFEVEAMPTVTDGQQRISSSAVRTALAAGDLVTAESLLGHPYGISGHVLHGNKLGRQLECPTMNLRVADHNHERKPPMTGIFVVQVYGLSDRPLPAVANLGYRPTVDDSRRVLLETHLLNFNRNVYGKLIRVEFLHKLRDEERFDSIDQLKLAIHSDIDQARRYFSDRS